MRKECKELKPGSADEATAGEAEKSRDAVQEFQRLLQRSCRESAPGRWWRRKGQSHDIEEGIFQNRRAGD